MFLQAVFVVGVIAVSGAQQFFVTNKYQSSACEGNPYYSEGKLEFQKVTTLFMNSNLVHLIIGVTIGSCLQYGTTSSIIYDVVEENGIYNVKTSSYSGSINCTGEPYNVENAEYGASCDMVEDAAQTIVTTSYITAAETRPWSTLYPGHIKYTWDNEEDCNPDEVEPSVVPFSFSYNALNKCMDYPMKYVTCKLDGTVANQVTYGYASDDLTCEESPIGSSTFTGNSCYGMVGTPTYGPANTDTCIN